MFLAQLDIGSGEAQPAADFIAVDNRASQKEIMPAQAVGGLHIANFQSQAYFAGADRDVLNFLFGDFDDLITGIAPVPFQVMDIALPVEAETVVITDDDIFGVKLI